MLVSSLYGKMETSIGIWELGRRDSRTKETEIQFATSVIELTSVSRE